MTLHLVATLAAGICAAGVIYLLYRLIGRKPAGYLMPTAAGVAMIGFTIWSEYSWASRTVNELPDYVVVVKEFPNRAAWRPWTYVIPQIDRFIAVDTSKIRRNERLPGYVLAEVLFVERRSPTAATQQLFDCSNARRTDVDPSKGFDDDGLPLDQNWTPIEADSAIYKTVCAPLSAE